MVKYFLLFTIVSLLIPFNILAQTPSDSIATVSPQVRNRLQLLTNPEILDNIFQRFYRHLQGLVNRLKIINMRIEKRLAKLDVTKTVSDRLKSQFSKITVSLDKISQELTDIEAGWKSIKETKSRDEFQSLRKRLTNLIALIEGVLTDQKNLIKEIKKYKAKV